MLWQVDENNTFTPGETLKIPAYRCTSLGKYVVLVEKTGSILVWDAAERKTVYSVLFVRNIRELCSDGTHLFTLSYNQVLCWRLFDDVLINSPSLS
jgi:hypothetical protein